MTFQLTSDLAIGSHGDSEGSCQANAEMKIRWHVYYHGESYTIPVNTTGSLHGICHFSVSIKNLDMTLSFHGHLWSWPMLSKAHASNV